MGGELSSFYFDVQIRGHQWPLDKSHDEEVSFGFLGVAKLGQSQGKYIGGIQPRPTRLWPMCVNSLMRAMTVMDWRHMRDSEL